MKNHVTGNEKTDEWYTNRQTVHLCYTLLGFTPLRPLLPFDTDQSWFVKEAQQRGMTPTYGITDFLTKETYDCDAILTNPPFSMKDAVIQRCYEYGVPTVLVLPLDSLGGKRRHEMFTMYGEPVVYVPAKRIAYFDEHWQPKPNVSFHSIIMLLNMGNTEERLILERA
jgi:hypothetical protein